MSRFQFIERWSAALLPGLICGMLAGCQPSGSPSQPTAPAEAAPERPLSSKRRQHHMLPIAGYNYTDRVIGGFSVNGQGGGNIGLTVRTSLPSGSTCCVGWLEGSELPRTVSVQWVSSYCMRSAEAYGDKFLIREPLWSVTDVQLEGPVPADPKNFEVHFYRNGKVEVAITRESSVPRVLLDMTPDEATRPGMTINDPPCPADYSGFMAHLHPKRIDQSSLKEP